MNWRRHRELLPHYLANLVLVLLTVGLVRVHLGDPGFPVELGIVVVTVLAYPSIARWFDVAPAAWEERDR